MLRPFATLLLLGTLTMPMIGCGDNPLVTPATPSPQTFLDIFTGQLTAGATAFYSFAVNTPGSTAVTLGSLIDVASGRALDSAIEVGIGVPAGSGCHVTTTVTVSPGLSSQIQQPLTSGVYCVRVRDVGQIRVPATFGVRISHT